MCACIHVGVLYSIMNVPCVSVSLLSTSFIGLLDEDYLSLLQDICIQCVFAGLERTSISSSSPDCVTTGSSSHNETLYSPHCLLSALRTARKLTQTKQARTLLNNFKQDSIELKKGDNSGMCVCGVCHVRMCACACMCVMLVCAY